jgi:DsbC/DsbD-like thiol-disulfide interchange protein
VKLDYLVCTDEICVPEKADLSTKLTMGDGDIDPDRRAASTLARACPSARRRRRPIRSSGKTHPPGRPLSRRGPPARAISSR